MDSVPGEYMKTYKPAEYGEPEFGFSVHAYCPWQQGGIDYAVDLFDSGEVMDKAIDAISAVPSASSMLSQIK